ncbi:hypothetical protein C8J56DRAFT_930810 [Mycena floridula]|nr:hypothetical protein C8J56DRAFT_930810 [Mycena floridula]
MDTETTIQQWVFTPESISPCFIRDIFNMKKENSVAREQDYFWLGRVPCRSVSIVGLLVGLQIVEPRLTDSGKLTTGQIIYTVDDGTAVIDCLYRVAPSSPVKSNGKPVAPPPLKPVAWVGSQVVLTGRVEPRHDSRRLVVQHINRCISANEEHEHWRHVRALHESSYSSLEPFVVPAPQAAVTHEPQTPSNSRISVVSSPSKSPQKSQQAPLKYRHPARLRSPELTGNTFRIYVHHFMANACVMLENEVDPEDTLRPKQARPSKDEHCAMRGFTMSYLRRVPDLALLARRVVIAETKRRAREQRKKDKESSQNTRPKSGSPVKLPAVKAPEPTSLKMKRLFKWALVQLLKQGSVVIWDGPTASYSSIESDTNTPGFSLPWKADVSSSSMGNSTVASSISEIFPDDEDDGNLSDPDPKEEAYVPLTTEYLALEVEKTLFAVLEHRRRSRGLSDISESTILTTLKRDDRWQRVSVTSVHEALEFLRDDGRAKENSDRWTI